MSAVSDNKVKTVDFAGLESELLLLNYCFSFYISVILKTVLYISKGVELSQVINYCIIRMILIYNYQLYILILNLIIYYLINCCC